METQVKEVIGNLIPSNRSACGIVAASLLDEKILEFRFTNHEAIVISGILPIHVSNIEKISYTGRKVWLNGIVHDELNIVMSKESSLPFEVALSFIKGLFQSIRRSSVIDPDYFRTHMASLTAERKQPELACYYEGCGSGDGWPNT